MQTRIRADVVIPRGMENTVALDVLEQHLVDVIERRTPDYSSTLLIASDILEAPTQPFKAVIS